MYNGYLARYEYLHTTFKEMIEKYRFNNFDSIEGKNTFKNLCDFYNNIIIKNLIKNDLLINFEFLFLDLKRIPELKVSLSDEILKSQFDFNSEYKKDFEIFACEEYISNQIGRDFLIIHNYLIKNHLMKNKNVYLLLNQCKERIHQYIKK